MIVAITGTPGTGKTEVSKALAKRLGWSWFSLNVIAAMKGLYEGYDSARMSKIVDIARLRAEVNLLATEHENFIIESHYAHDMPCDMVIVLRTDTTVLRKRMLKKGFHTEKVAENIEAEMMQIIIDEAKAAHKNVHEIDTTRKKPGAVAKEIEAIINDQSYVEKDLAVPERLVMEFRMPFGKLYKGDKAEATKAAVKELRGFRGLLVTVGDSASYSLIKSGIKPHMIVVDGREKRGKFKNKIPFKGTEIKVRNPKAHITARLWKAVEKSIPALKKKKVRITVSGEEDLAVLPCAIHLPLGSKIVYGQFDEGLVVVTLDEEKKQRAKALLENILFSQ